MRRGIEVAREPRQGALHPAGDPVPSRLPQSADGLGVHAHVFACTRDVTALEPPEVPVCPRLGSHLRIAELVGDPDELDVARTAQLDAVGPQHDVVTLHQHCGDHRGIAGRPCGGECLVDTGASEHRVGRVDGLDREAYEQERSGRRIRVTQRFDGHLEGRDALGVGAADIALPAPSVCQRRSRHARTVADPFREPPRLEQHLTMRRVADPAQRFAGHRHDVDARRVGCARRRRRGRRPASAIAMPRGRRTASSARSAAATLASSCARRFGTRFVPVAREHGAVSVEVLGAQAFDGLRDRTVEAQPASGRDLVEQGLLHQRVREPVAHRRAAELVDQARDARRFERVDGTLPRRRR